MAEGFAAVPIWMLDDERFTAHMVMTYAALASHSDRSGVSFPKIKQLLVRAKISTSSVQRALRALEEIGVVETREHVDETGQKSNLYIIHNYDRGRARDPRGSGVGQSDRARKSRARGATPANTRSVTLTGGAGHTDRPLREPDPVEPDEDKAAPPQGSYPQSDDRGLDWEPVVTIRPDGRATEAQCVYLLDLHILSGGDLGRAHLDRMVQQFGLLTADEADSEIREALRHIGRGKFYRGPEDHPRLSPQGRRMAAARMLPEAERAR